MGQPVGVSVHLHDLVRHGGEPRWTVLVDGVLALGVVGWVVALALVDPGPTLRFAVPFSLALVVVVRVVVLVEHVQSWREHALAETPAPVAAAAPGERVAGAEPPRAA